jgi:hypothetical protein
MIQDQPWKSRSILAIAYPEVATWKVVVVLRVLLVIAGIAEVVVHAVLVRNLRGFALHSWGHDLEFRGPAYIPSKGPEQRYSHPGNC